MSNFAPWFPAIPEFWKGVESPYGRPVPLAYGLAWVSPIQVFSGPQFSKWQGTAPADANLGYSMRVMKFVTNEATGDVDSSGVEFVSAQSAVLVLCEQATAILDVLVGGVSVKDAGAGSTTQGFVNALCASNWPPADEFYTANKLPSETYGGYFHAGTTAATAHERLYPPSTHLTAPTTYDDVCHIAFSTLGIGKAEARPKFKFRVQALLAQSSTVGAHPADVALDLWKRAGKPEHLQDGTTHTLDVETYYRAYVTSGGGSGSTDWRVSRAVEDQTSAADLLQSLLDETFCTAITLENGVVRIVPRDAGNTTAYALGVNDFVLSEGSDPVVIERKQASDCFNCFPVKYQVVTASGSHDVTNEDTTFAVAHPVASRPDGILRAPAVNAQWISTAEHALNLSALLARESFTVRSTYKFSLHPRWVLLQVGDIVSLTEPHLGLSSKAARITRLSEDGNGLISVEAQEWFDQVAYTTPAVDPFDGFGTTLPGTPGDGEAGASSIYAPELDWLHRVEVGGVLAAVQKPKVLSIFERIGDDLSDLQTRGAPFADPASSTYDSTIGAIQDHLQHIWGTPPVVVTGTFTDLSDYLMAADGLDYPGPWEPEYSTWLGTSCSLVGTELSTAFRNVIEDLDRYREALRSLLPGSAQYATLEASHTVAARDGTVSRTLAARFSDAVNVMDFGAVGNGIADDTAAIQACITAAEARAGSPGRRTPSAVVLIPGGQTYVITAPLVMKYGFVTLSGYGATLKAGGAMTDMVTMGWEQDDHLLSVTPDNQRVEGLRLDGNSLAQNGVRIVSAQGASVADVFPWYCTNAGIYLDGGHSGPGGTSWNQRVLNVRFENVFPQGCGWSFLIDGNGNAGSFAGFSFNGCGDEEASSGSIRLIGAPDVSWYGGNCHQLSGKRAVYLSDSSRISIYSGRFEGSSTVLPVLLDTCSTIIAYNTSFAAGVEFADDRSRAVMDGSYVSAVTKNYRQSLGLLSDSLLFGPPGLWPTHNIAAGPGGTPAIRYDVNNAETGFSAIKGETWIDVMGVEWVCTTDGITSSPGPYPRFVPRYGKVIIPIDPTYGNDFFWWNHEDFVFDEMTLVITESWTGSASSANFGSNTPAGFDTQAWFSSAQLPTGSLVAGATFKASSNATTNANLLGGKKWFSAGGGSALAAAATSYGGIYLYVNGGSFSAGKGFLVVEGTNLLWQGGVVYQRATVSYPGVRL